MLYTWPPPPANRTNPDDAELHRRQREIKLRYQARRTGILIGLITLSISIWLILNIGRSWICYAAVFVCLGLMVYLVVDLCDLPRQEREELATHEAKHLSETA